MILTNLKKILSKLSIEVFTSLVLRNDWDETHLLQNFIYLRIIAIILTWRRLHLIHNCFDLSEIGKKFIKTLKRLIDLGTLYSDFLFLFINFIKHSSINCTLFLFLLIRNQPSSFLDHTLYGNFCFIVTGKAEFYFAILGTYFYKIIFAKKAWFLYNFIITEIQT